MEYQTESKAIFSVFFISFMVSSGLLILRSWHVSGSTLSLFGWQQAHPPSNARPHRWPAGRQDSGLQAEPEWTGG